MNRNLFSVNRFINILTKKRFLSLSSTAERISENDPRDHKLMHVGKLYNISNEHFSGCFEYQMKSDFIRLLKVFNDTSIIIRKEAIEVIDYMRNTDYSQPIVRYVLYGPLGSGKTVTMAHISHYAFTSSDWLIVHFSNLKKILQMSPELTIHTKYENMFDTPTLAAEWLQTFLSLNSNFLKKHNPKLLKPIEWNQNESLPANAPWTDLINFAISRPKYACDGIGILLREAREHALLDHFKVMGVIRGINNLWYKSRRCDNQQQNICASRFTVLNYLRRFIRNDWNNGVIVSSVDREEINQRPLPDSATHYPRNLLGDEGFKDMDPMVPIHVDKFSDAEVHNYLNFLNENHWLTVDSAKDPNGIGRREIVFLADNRPGELFNVTYEW